MPTKEYHREWARKNKEKRQLLNKKWQGKRIEWYKNYKKQLKCSRCGEQHPACIQFHHKDRSQKDFAVSKAAKGWSINRIMEEIDKCIILCANCHLKEHHSERF